MYKYLCIYLLAPLLSLALAGCGQKGGSMSQAPESRQAKQLLQGVWADAESEDVVLKMEGDSVYFPDSTSMPAYFKVVGDSLYIGASTAYLIEKQTRHLLWLKSVTNERLRLVQVDADSPKETFRKGEEQIQALTEVLKRDTVLMYKGQRYHLYIAVNPTKYKVVRQTLNEDGFNVENVYYDNIIHLSVFKGADQLFSRDFKKSFYQQKVPSLYLDQSVLNDMRIDGVADDGFHVHASLCTPGEASCYLVGHVVAFDGHLSTQLLEY